MKKIMYYFGYGRNINSNSFKDRGITFKAEERMAVTLLDYELRFNKKSLRYSGYGVANINKKLGAKVEGILYLIPDHQIDQLDTFEGYPNHYVRETITVQTKDGKLLEAVTYTAAPDFIQEGLAPHSEYLHAILEGAKEMLSSDHIRYLEMFL